MATEGMEPIHPGGGRDAFDPDGDGWRVTTTPRMMVWAAFLSALMFFLWVGFEFIPALKDLVAFIIRILKDYAKNPS
jgi:hypothetical protein